MKTRYIDPFTPDLPIDDPRKFSGRKVEVDKIADSIFQTANNKPKHTIITGDRGIGKSSLLLQASHLCQGSTDLTDRFGIDIGGTSFDFLTAWHDCAIGQTAADVARGILNQIENRFSRAIGKLNFSINLGGFVTISKEQQSPSEKISEVVNLFCEELIKISGKLNESSKNGLICFFDEVDRVKKDSGVATFFKLSSERLARERIWNIGFFAAGISGAVQQLEEEHGSIYRTFRDIPLPNLERDEVEEILTEGFDSVGVSYDRKVIAEVFKSSVGFPEPVHLLGSQILAVDEDGHIDISDYRIAMKQTVESLRRNKLASTLKAAGSGKYQLIMKAMASYEGKNVPLRHISQEIDHEQNQYSTNMANLVERNIISQVDRGVYTFVDPLLKEYISRFGIIDATE